MSKEPTVKELQLPLPSPRTKHLERDNEKPAVISPRLKSSKASPSGGDKTKPSPRFHKSSGSVDALDERMIGEVIGLARTAVENGNHPFGALLTGPKGTLVGLICAIVLTKEETFVLTSR